MSTIVTVILLVHRFKWMAELDLQTNDYLTFNLIAHAIRFFLNSLLATVVSSQSKKRRNAIRTLISENLIADTSYRRDEIQMSSAPPPVNPYWQR